MKRGVAVVLAVAAILIWWFHHNQKHLAFSSTRWKELRLDESLGEEAQTARLEMIDSLLESHNLVGTTKMEIEDLLGLPDDSERTRVWYYVAEYRRNLIIEYDAASGKALAVIWN